MASGQSGQLSTGCLTELAAFQLSTAVSTEDCPKKWHGILSHQRTNIRCPRSQWGVYKYLAIPNEWENVIKYPPKYCTTPDAVTFDKENNKILIWDDTDYWTNKRRPSYNAIQRMNYLDLNTFSIDQNNLMIHFEVVQALHHLHIVYSMNIIICI